MSRGGVSRPCRAADVAASRRLWEEDRDPLRPARGPGAELRQGVDGDASVGGLGKAFHPGLRGLRADPDA